MATADDRCSSVALGRGARIVLGLVVVLVFAACPLPTDPEDSDGGGTPDPEVVATPSLSPAPGAFSLDVEVEIGTVTSGATIFYTVDGSAPSASSSVYSGPISVAGHGTSTTIRTLATKSGFETSNEASGTYEIAYNTVAAPSFSPVPDTYNDNVDVTLLSSTSGATIYYTTNGSEPTDASNVYSSAIPVAGDGTSVTIKALAVKDGMLDSAVSSGTFVIEYVLTAPTGLSADTVLFDSVTLSWNSVDLADEYVLDRYYVVMPGAPSPFTGGWSEVYRGTDTSFVDSGLWGGRELYYRVGSYSATKGEVTSSYIRADTPVGEIAFSHNLGGTYTYRDANAYASKSGNTWYFNVDNSLNNQSSDFENYGYIIALGQGPSYGDAGTVIKLSPGATDYELTNTSVVLTTIGAVGERVEGSFAGYYGATPVSGSFSLIRRPDQ